MSDKTETRVVKMEFDNAKFERDVKQSMNTLDKFDKKLRLNGVTDSIEKVTKSFSKFEIVTMATIANITNRFVNLGIRMVKSLSVDNVSAGWDKFGQKTTAVATMAAQKIKMAGKELTNYEEKMAAINDQLEKLNWFTDETSYNFTDMVNTIGQFTAAGQDLDKSVNAIMGIANWAALSGKNAQTASRAMYQLAQAMGRGYIMGQDWMSIQTAGMATKEFKEQVLETALAMGELTKAGNEYITKAGKKITAENFDLSSRWFTTDILVNSLQKYSSAVEKIFEISSETGLTASMVMKRYSSVLDEFGLKAFKAAQEARTFADAINSVRDAVSTGWMNTFEKIFGTYDESKELWTDLANELYDVFAEGGNFRNEVLALWKDLGGRSDLFDHGDKNQGAFWNIYDSVVAVKDIVKESWDTIFPKSQFGGYNDQVEDLANNFKIFTNRLKVFTDSIKNTLKDNEKLSNIFKGLFSLVKIGAQALAGLRYTLDPLLNLAKNILGDVIDRISYLVNHTNKLEKIIEGISSASFRLHDIIQEIIDVIDPREVLGMVYTFLLDIFNTIKNNAPVEKFFETVKDFFVSLKENGANANNFSRIMNGLVSIFNTIFRVVTELVKLVSKYLLPVLSAVVDVLAKLTSFAAGLLINLVALVGDLFVLIDSLLQSSSIENAGSTLNNFLSTLSENAKKAEPLLKGFINVFASIIDLILLIPTLLDKVSMEITGKSLIENLTDLINSIATGIKGFTESINGERIGKELSPLATFIKGIADLLKGIYNVLGGVLRFAGQVLTMIGKFLQFIGSLFDGIVDFMDGATLASLLNAVTIIASLALILLAISNALYLVQAALTPLTYTLTTVADSVDKWANSKIVESIGSAIHSIGLMILEIGIGVTLLSKTIDVNAFLKGLEKFIWFAGIAGVTIATVLIVINAIKSMKETFTKVYALTTELADTGESVKNSLKKTNISKIFYSIAALLSAIGTSMIKISIAFSIMSGLSKSAFERGIAVLGIFSGLVISLSAIAAFGKKNDEIVDRKEQSKRIKGLGTLMIALSVTFKVISSALTSISKLSPNRLWIAVGAMTTIFGVLTACVGVLMELSKMSSSGTIATIQQTLMASSNLPVAVSGQQNKMNSRSSANTGGIAGLLMSAAAMMFTISLSLSLLSALKPERLWGAVGSLTAMVTVLTLAIIGISKFTKEANSSLLNGNGKQINNISKIFASISKMMLSISASLMLLAMINPGRVWSSLFAVVTLLMSITGSLILLTNLTGNNRLDNGSLMNNIKQLESIIKAMAIMAISLAVLSNMPIGGIAVSATALVVLMGSIVASLLLMNKFASGLDMDANKNNAMAIAEIVGSLVLLTVALSVLSNMPLAGIAVATASLTIILAGIVGSLVVINKACKGMSTSDLIKNILLLTSMVGVMFAFAGALSMLTNMKWDTILAASGGFSLVMATIVGAVALLTALQVGPAVMLAFAASMAIIGASLLVLARALIELNKVDMLGVAKGLLVLAGSLAVLGIAGVLLDKVKIAIIAIGAAVAMIGVGLFLLANVLPVLLQTLKEFVEYVSGNSDKFKESVELIAGVIVNSLLNAVESFVDKIARILPKIFNLIGTYFGEILGLIKSKGPELIETLLTLVDALVKSLSEHLPSIYNNLLVIIDSLLEALETNIKNIAIRLINIVIQLLEALTEKIPELIPVVIDFLIATLTAVYTNLPKLYAAVLPLMIQAIVNILQLLAKNLVPVVSLLVEIIMVLLDTALKLVLNLLSYLLPEIIAVVGGLLLLIVKAVDGLVNVIYQTVKYIAVVIIKIFGRVFEDLLPLILAAGRLLGASLAKGVIDALYGILKYVPFINDLLRDAQKSIGGFLDSAREDLDKYGSASNVTDAIREAGRDILGSMTDIADIMSDITSEGLGNIRDTVATSLGDLSEIFGDFGNDVGSNLSLGLSQGAKDTQQDAYDAGALISSSAEEGAKEEAGIHSPSTEFMEIGKYMCEGLVIGLNEGKQSVIDEAIDMINSTIQSIQDIIAAAITGDVLTITPILDLSNVESGANDIAGLMSGVSGRSVSLSKGLARSASQELGYSRSVGGIPGASTINNGGDTYNSTFNVTTNDPQGFSEDVDRQLQHQRMMSRLAKGGAK